MENNQQNNHSLPRIHQIFLSNVEEVDLPSNFKMAVNTVRATIPHSIHKIYSNAELQEWIPKEFGTDVLRAFNKLKPYAYRADIARLLLLYRYGGWYFDITIRVLNGIQVGEDIELVTFLDLPHNSNVTYACSNGIIYAKKRSLIVEYSLNEALRNIAAGSYGQNLLDITGPLVFGRAVARFQSKCNVISGTFMDLTPGMQNRNRAFVFNNGMIFALHKQGNIMGDLESLGAKGTNNYSIMYLNRDVYDKYVDYSEPTVIK